MQPIAVACVPAVHGTKCQQQAWCSRRRFVVSRSHLPSPPSSVCGSGAQAPATSATSFGGLIAGLSEPNGYFDTDNLISNEQSYLTVLPDIDRAGLRGGAYIGVGPDQNFSYIAAARPAVAFIIDVRRDNLLLHLLFKALFSLARTRVEYLALLCGRPAPANIEAWRSKRIDALTAYVDQAGVPEAAAVNDASGAESLRPSRRSGSR